LNYFHL